MASTDLNQSATKSGIWKFTDKDDGRGTVSVERRSGDLGSDVRVLIARHPREDDPGRPIVAAASSRVAPGRCGYEESIELALTPIEARVLWSLLAAGEIIVPGQDTGGTMDRNWCDACGEVHRDIVVEHCLKGQHCTYTEVVCAMDMSHDDHSKFCCTCKEVMNRRPTYIQARFD